MGAAAGVPRGARALGHTHDSSSLYNGDCDTCAGPAGGAGTRTTRGVTAGQFAVAWVLNNRLVTAVIGGPRTEPQWHDYFGALAYRFTADDEAFIDGLVVSGHPSTPGYNDPAYPIEGRIARSGSDAALSL